MGLMLGTAAGLAFGTALGQLHTLPWVVLPAALSVLTAACWRRSVWLLWLAALLAGTSLATAPRRDPALLRQLPLLQGVTGRVTGFPEPHRATVSFVLESEAMGRLFVYLRTERPTQLEVLPGDRVRLSGEGELPSPGGWADSLARRGIGGIFWAEEVRLLEEGRPSPLRAMARFRWQLLGVLDRTLPRPGAELLSALLLGARGRLPGEAKEAFRTAGVAHLLALSGLHLGILAALGWWGLGLLRLPPGWRYLLLLPLLWGYVLLGGARISLVRAGIMLTLLGLFYLLWERGLVLRRWRDPLEGLGAAAIVVLILWPWSASDLGFQLSFAATFAILFLWPSWSGCPLRGRLPRPVRWGADLLITSAFAQVGTLPLVGSNFGYIAPWGLLANLLLIPWTGLILGAGLFLLAISPLPGAVAVGGFLERTLISPYLWLVRGLATLPGAALPVGEGFGLWCLLCALAVLLLRVAQEELREGVLLPSTESAR
ncbi:ComEC family competence protein [Candidatus Bipolaricaulota bacterium]|nr:ComEC family competence protein [Candidatus Bipolaricaulota bacterium]